MPERDETTAASYSEKDFAARIRQKYPGSYDGVSDQDLTAKILAKYPQYKDSVLISRPGQVKTTQPEFSAQADADRPAEAQPSSATIPTPPKEETTLSRFLKAMTPVSHAFFTSPQEAQQVGKQLQQPLLPVGKPAVEAANKVDPEKHPVLATLADAGAVGAQVLEGLSTPGNVALLTAMAATPEAGIPLAAKRLVTLGFSYEQAKAAISDFKAGIDAYSKGDARTGRRYLMGSAVQGLFAALGAKSAIGNGDPLFEKTHTDATAQAGAPEAHENEKIAAEHQADHDEFREVLNAAGVKLPKNPTIGEARAAYRQAMRNLHPDTAEGDVKSFDAHALSSLFSRLKKSGAFLEDVEETPEAVRQSMGDRLSDLWNQFVTSAKAAVRRAPKPVPTPAEPPQLEAAGHEWMGKPHVEAAGEAAAPGEPVTPPHVETPQAPPKAAEPAPTEAEKPTVIGSPEERVVAERPETVQKQVEALQKGTIPAVMIPAGGEVPATPAGMEKLVIKSGPGAGVWFFNPAKVNEFDIRAKAATGRHGELLGHLQTKEDLAGKPTVVVQAVDKATGVPIQDSEVDATDKARIDKQKQVMGERHPEAEVVVKSPEEVKADRTAPDKIAERREKAHKLLADVWKDKFSDVPRIPAGAEADAETLGKLLSDRHATLQGITAEADPQTRKQLFVKAIAPIDKVLRDPSSSDWLKESLRAALEDEPPPKDESEPQPKFSYGSTQANIPADSEAATALEAARSRIADSDLMAKGKDVGGNHITVRYGIESDDVDGVREFLKAQPPFEATLGKTSVFDPSDHSDGAAVVVAPIDAPALHRMNAELEEHGDFTEPSFADYRPHATLAYVRPEAANRYVGMTVTDGKKFKVDRVAITDRFGNEEVVRLEGKEPEKAEVLRVPVGSLVVDPKKFQYKLNVDESGVTGILSGRKWNENLAGIVSVWYDPKTEETYVVNGHHRVALAKENGIPSVLVKYIKADNAKDARTIGALQNIGEGRGTAVDAAKFFRDTGFNIDELAQQGITLTEAVAENGIALARLSQPIFDEVATGKMKIGRGVAIGRATDDPAQQDAILKLIRKKEKGGRPVTNDVVEELGRMVKGAKEHTESQDTLFGVQEMTRNLMLEKAEVSDYIRKKISGERRLFAGVADAGKAETLGKAGNVIEAEKNAEIAQQAAQAQELYDRLSTRSGEIDDVLNRAASDLADGDNPNEVKQRAYEDVREAVSKILGEKAPGTAEGVQAAGGTEGFDFGAEPGRPTHEVPAGELRSGDTFIDDKGEPRRVISVEGDKVRTADGEPKTFEGAIPVEGELNSPRSQVAAGGKFRPPPPSMTFPGMEEAVEGQKEAAAAKRGEDLTAELTRPKGSIEAQAGKMERESPLFAGTEASPQPDLFSTAAPEEQRMFDLFGERKIPAEEMRPGDTFVDAQGEPRRVLSVEGDEVRAADGDIRTFKGDVPVQGDLNSAKSKLAQGGKFHPVEESKEPQPTWYLKSKRLVEGIMPNKARGETVLNMLQNNGVKADEIKWTGLDDFLKGKESVTKQEVLDYLDANNTQVQEVMHEEAPDNEANTRWIPETKFEQYVTPGGSNYRELLLTLPTENKRLGDLNARMKQIAERTSRMTVEQREADPSFDEEFYRLVKERDAIRESGKFTGGHFDEPNVLAHIRFNDRTDAQGKKVLFIEEIQSDWHQKGRKHGYKDQELQAKKDAARARVVAAFEKFKPLLKQADYLGYDNPRHAENDIASRRYKVEDIDETGVPGLRDAAREVQEAVHEEGTLNSSTTFQVPDAPFKKDWHELALKRMLRYAAENGYDRLSWTTGDMQNERYDLSKQVDTIQVQRGHGSGYLVTAIKDGNEVMDREAKTESDLAELIGKDLATKASEQRPGETKKYEGIDLKLGGQGMRGFYDKIIPDFLNKYGKKWGAKVGETRIDAGERGPSGGDRYVVEKVTSGYRIVDMSGSELGTFMGGVYETLKEAQRDAVEMNGSKQNAVPALDITPDMRDSVMKGQALYSGFMDPQIVEELFPNIANRFDKWVRGGADFADEQAAMMRQTRGEKDRKVAAAYEKLKATHKEWTRRSRDDSKALMNAIETGDFSGLSNDDAQLAQMLKSGYDPLKRDIEALKPEMAEIWLKDYFPHIWKRPSRARKYIERALAQKRPFAGAESFRKQRKIPTTAEGIALGLEPVSWNPIDLFMLKFNEMAQFLMAHKTLDMMKENGTAKFVRVGEAYPEGWTQLDDRIGTVYGKETVDVARAPEVVETGDRERTFTIIRGHYYAPAEAAKVFNNFVSTGFAGRNAAYDIAQWLNNNINALQLGISAFHATTTSVNAATSDVALGIQQLYRGAVKGEIETVAQGALSVARGVTLVPSMVNTFRNGGKIAAQYLSDKSLGEFEREARAIELAGGRHHMNSIEIKPLDQLKNAIHNRAPLEVVGNLPGALIEATVKPVMEWYVPRMKFGAFYSMAHDILAQADKENWPEAKIRARMQAAWDSIDNRFGQMVYDNLFWHKGVRDSWMLATRSVGWNLGTLRELALAPADVAQQAARSAKYGTAPEITDRMAFAIALPLVTALMGAALTYYLTGERPKTWKDYFYPRKKDGTRVSMPGYMKDVFAYGMQPIRTIGNKFGPLIEMMSEAIQNRDFYGEEIVHKDDPVVKQMAEFGRWFGKTVMPFSFTGAAKLIKKGGGDTSSLTALLKSAAKNPQDVILGQFGFQPAASYIQNTPALNKAREYDLANRPPGTRTHEAAEKQDVERQVEQMYREKKVDQTKIREYISSGRLSREDVIRARGKAQHDPLYLAADNLSIEQLLNVYKVASDDEKKILRPIIRRKEPKIREVTDVEKRMQLKRAYDDAVGMPPQQPKVEPAAQQVY